MGGYSAGDRSDPALMIRVCVLRHREGKYSIDRGMVRWEALTAAGAAGPVRWLIEVRALPWELFPPLQLDGTELEIATETAPYEWETFTPWQAAVLNYLATMQD